MTYQKEHTNTDLIEECFFNQQVFLRSSLNHKFGFLSDLSKKCPVDVWKIMWLPWQGAFVALLTQNNLQKLPFKAMQVLEGLCA